MKILLHFLVLAALLLTACPGPSTGDAGLLVSDSGTAPDDDDDDDDDGGTPAQDGGTEDGDAGQVPPEDGGPPPAPHAPPTPAAAVYFADIDETLVDQALVDALQGKLAADHVELSFDALFDAYATTNTGRGGCEGIFDFYSDQCWAHDDACGQYSQEGDCFNREHSWPKSWWGGGQGADQHQDIIAVVPTDGFVNGIRANLPFGLVTNPNYTSTNGSRRGACTGAGAPSGTICFEPADGLKGDMARIFFYMAVRYEREFTCCDELAVTNADLDGWQEALLRQWHASDPVDLDERERNERVYGLQQNRNPFVDFPQYVDRIADF